VTVAPNPVSATGTIYRSYSGMAGGNGKVWSIGGGHAGHPGNCVDMLDIASGVWTLPFPSEAPDPYIAGVPNGTWRALKGGGSPVGGLSPTGRPWCKHAYRHMAVDTTRDALIFLSGNGLGSYSTAGVWTQLAGRDANLNEPNIGAAGGIIYDPERDSVWVFAGDTTNGLTRGIFEYSFATDSFRRVQPWAAFSGWGFGSKYIMAHYVPQSREVFLICSPTGGTIPQFPNRLFRYNLETGSLVWESTLVAGTTAYEELRGPEGKWNRFTDVRTVSGQLYCYTSAYGSVAAGFWVFTPAAGSGGTWTKQLTPGGPTLNWWTLCYDGTTDTFAGLRARTLYCGVPGAACGGVADTHLFSF